MTLVQALEQACREETGDRGSTCTLWRHVRSDAAAVVHHGAITGRVAYILGWPEDKVRRHLHGMAVDGTVLKHNWRPRSPIRWWPVGLYAQLQAEGAEG